MPRPSKLTPEVQDAVLRAVKVGGYREVAAAAAGVHRRTLERWLARGAEHDGDNPPKTEAPYVEFCRAIEKAEAEAELMFLARIQQDANGWQRYMTILERKYPDRWGRRERIEHTGKDGKAIKVTTDAIEDPDTQEAAHALLARLGSGETDAGGLRSAGD